MITKERYVQDIASINWYIFFKKKLKILLKRKKQVSISGINAISETKLFHRTFEQTVDLGSGGHDRRKYTKTCSIFLKSTIKLKVIWIINKCRVWKSLKPYESFSSKQSGPSRSYRIRDCKNRRRRHFHPHMCGRGEHRFVRRIDGGTGVQVIYPVLWQGITFLLWPAPSAPKPLSVSKFCVVKQYLEIYSDKALTDRENFKEMRKKWSNAKPTRVWKIFDFWILNFGVGASQSLHLQS